MCIRDRIGSSCKAVSSFGSLAHFNAAHKPAGAPPYCLDGCTHRDEMCIRDSSYDTQGGTALDIRQNFFNGKSAFYIDGVWAHTDLVETTSQQDIRYAAFPGRQGETISYANPATGYVISNVGSPKQIDACVRFLKYMLSEDVQEQMVTKTHQAPSNPKIEDEWIRERVPILADAVQVCKEADQQILTLYSVLPIKSFANLEQRLEELLRDESVQQSIVAIITDSD